MTPRQVHQHDEFGEVLVLGVHHIFEEYDLESKDGPVATRVVEFSVEWDAYGAMPSSIRTTPVDAFRGAVGEAIRTADLIDSSADRERGHSDGE